MTNILKLNNIAVYVMKVNQNTNRYNPHAFLPRMNILYYINLKVVFLFKYKNCTNDLDIKINPLKFLNVRLFPTCLSNEYRTLKNLNSIDFNMISFLKAVLKFEIKNSGRSFK